MTMIPGVRCRAWWTSLVALVVALPVQATSVSTFFSGRYGELIENAPITASVSLSDASISCSVAPTVTHVAPRTVVVTVGRVASDPGCTPLDTVALGTFAAGPLTVTVRAVPTDTFLPVVEATQTIDVLPLAGRCSADPELNAEALFVVPRGDADALAARVASDPAYAGRLGHPTIRVVRVPGAAAELRFGYPPLQDPTVEVARLLGLDEIASVSRNARLCFATPPPDSVADVVEFHHAALDQYFYSADAGEIAAIDAGAVGAGWRRTGERFSAVTAPGCPFADGSSPVYRFAATPGAPTGAHFFTRDRAECYVVAKGAQWSFEGLPFWAAPPDATGACGPGRKALLRLWRPTGASTHRFTTSPAIVDTMVAQGWVNEGVAMCVRP